MGKTEAIDMAAIIHKRWLTPEEAVALGYFSSVKAATMRRYRGQHPGWSQEAAGARVLYDRNILDTWLESVHWSLWEEDPGG